TFNDAIDGNRGEIHISSNNYYYYYMDYNKTTLNLNNIIKNNTIKIGDNYDYYNDNIPTAVLKVGENGNFDNTTSIQIYNDGLLEVMDGEIKTYTLDKLMGGTGSTNYTSYWDEETQDYIQKETYTYDKGYGNIALDIDFANEEQTSDLFNVNNVYGIIKIYDANILNDTNEQTGEIQIINASNGYDDSFSFEDTTLFSQNKKYDFTDAGEGKLSYTITDKADFNITDAVLYDKNDRIYQMQADETVTNALTMRGENTSLTIKGSDNAGAHTLSFENGSININYGQTINAIDVTVKDSNFNDYDVPSFVRNQLGKVGTISGTFENNEAYRGSVYSTYGIYDYAEYKGLYPAADLITGVFKNNKTQRYGGVIYNYAGYINTASGEFTGNSAESGGAIYSDNSIFNNISGTFTSNSAEDVGGAIYIRGYAGNIIADFTENTAGDTGGAIYNDEGYIEKIEGNFTGNTASEYGGAIANSNGGSIIAVSGNFINNKAQIGGAIFNHMSVINSLSGTFEGNEAEAFGGALLNMYGIVNIVADDTNTVFTGNKAAGASNAIATSVGITNMNANTGKIIINDAIGFDVAAAKEMYAFSLINDYLFDDKDSIKEIIEEAISQAENEGNMENYISQLNNYKDNLSDYASIEKFKELCGNLKSIIAEVYDSENWRIEELDDYSNKIDSLEEAANKQFNANNNILNINPVKSDVEKDTGKIVKTYLEIMLAQEGYDEDISQEELEEMMAYYSSYYETYLTQNYTLPEYNTGVVEINNKIEASTVNLWNGTLKLGSIYDGDTLVSRGDFAETTNLNINGGLLDVKDGVINTYTLNNLVVNGGNITLDIDLLNNTADKFITTTANGNITLSDINFMNDLTEGGTIQVVTYSDADNSDISITGFKKSFGNTEIFFTDNGEGGLTYEYSIPVVNKNFEWNVKNID
ncbi:hypothetical protein II906_11900, partial [bacterium]|nr:hypothetical protein [bacterium]